MLNRGKHPAVVRTTNVGTSEPPYQRGVLAKGPDINHRVAWVVVDVYNRCEVHVYANGPRLNCCDPASLIGQLFVARCPKCHRTGEYRAATDPETDTGLKIT